MHRWTKQRIISTLFRFKSRNFLENISLIIWMYLLCEFVGNSVEKSSLLRSYQSSSIWLEIPIPKYGEKGFAGRRSYFLILTFIIGSDGVEGGDMLIQHALQVFINKCFECIDSRKNDWCCQEHVDVTSGNKASCFEHYGNSCKPNQPNWQYEGRSWGSR